MSKIVLSPYPRLATSSVVWGAWTSTIDDRAIALEEIADQVDAHSNLTFSTSVAVPVRDLELLNLDTNDSELVLTVSSNATALSMTSSATLARSGSDCRASATVTVPANAVAETIVLRTQLITKSGATGWLTRRIIADGPVFRVPLHTDQVGFPTVSYSFENANLPNVPWRLIVEADDPEASFMHSVRLELNEDFPAVCEYLDGKNMPMVSSQIIALIVRVLVGTVSRMVSNDGDQRTPEEIAMQAPNSITASAARAANQYLRRSLNWAVAEYKSRPEVFEMALAERTAIPKGR